MLPNKSSKFGNRGSDLKTIYHAPDEQTTLARLDEVRATWEQNTLAA